MNGLIIDINDDTSLSIYKKIQEEYDIPSAIIKTANIHYKEKQAFALPSIKKFPLDDANDVLLSHLYLQKTATNLKPEQVRLAQSNINEAASLMGIPLTFKKKEASIKEIVEYEIPVEKFAIAISVDDISDELKQKTASLIYQDHLCMYPLDSEVNIKKANMYFPKNLEQDLEPLRVEVATKIASLLPESELTSAVKEYTQIHKKSEVESVLYKRASDHPYYKERYMKLIQNIPTSNDEILVKFASELNEIDIESNYKGNEKAFKYLSGIQDDTNYSKHKIKLASCVTNFENIVNNKTKLASYFKEDIINNVIQTPKKFQDYYDSNNHFVKQAMENLIVNGQ